MVIDEQPSKVIEGGHDEVGLRMEVSVGGEEEGLERACFLNDASSISNLGFFELNVWPLRTLDIASFWSSPIRL